MISSLWESKWFFHYNTIIVGGGIIGLSTAASILEKHPSHRVLILERGLIPTGASTRNAGIAAAGDFEGFLDDIDTLGEKGAVELVKSFRDSVAKMRKRLGDEAIDYKQYGGYNILSENTLHKLEKLEYVNKMLRPIFNEDVFQLKNEKIEEFGLNKDIVKALVYNRFEGQIDSGKTVMNMLEYVQKLGANVINGAEVTDYKHDADKSVIVNVKNPLVPQEKLQFRCQNLAICTNGFSETFIKDFDMYPARGQVIVTSPIKDLKFKGSFVWCDGYYYLRDYYGRVLLGGGRHLDIAGETTTEMKTTKMITDDLKQQLKEVILPGQEFSIEHEWAGIMCFGKKSHGPVVMKLKDNVYSAIRMSGIGMSLSAYIGEKLEDLIFSSQQIHPKL